MSMYANEHEQRKEMKNSGDGDNQKENMGKFKGKNKQREDREKSEDEGYENIEEYALKFGIGKEDVERVFSREVSEEQVEEVVERSEELLNKVAGGFLYGELAKIKLLLMMVRDYWKKEYKEIPIYTILMAVLALLYILTPTDMIPDFIPILGQLDDYLVLKHAWKAIGEDIKEYARWKIKKGGKDAKEVFELYERAFG